MITGHQQGFWHRSSTPHALLAFGLLCTASAQAQGGQIKPDLPLSIDRVETYRIDNSLIRIIRHNMELQPLLEIERISTPDVKLMEKLRIDTISLKGETLHFKDADGVFIESLNLNNDVVEFTIDYYFPRGGVTSIKCNVNADKNGLETPRCERLDTQ